VHAQAGVLVAFIMPASMYLRVRLASRFRVACCERGSRDAKSRWGSLAYVGGNAVGILSIVAGVAFGVIALVVSCLNDFS